MITLPLCNGIPERAPKIGQFIFPLCWRCTGLFIGISLFSILAFVFNFEPVTYIWTALLGIPALLDVYCQIFFNYKGSNIVRFITGIFLGVSTIGVSTFTINSIFLLKDIIKTF
jgi:uncharacterized membrane protein